MEAHEPVLRTVLEATTEDRYVEASRSLQWVFSCQCWGRLGGRALSAQTELLDQRAVAVDVGPGQVVEQPATATDEQEQTAA